MDSDHVGRRLAFLSSRLEDPRRIQLRQGKFLQAYCDRRDVDDITEVSYDLTKLHRVGIADMADLLAVFTQPTTYSIEYTQDRDYPLQARTQLPEPRFQTVPSPILSGEGGAPAILMRARSRWRN